jgi:hypothetical protein
VAHGQNVAAASRRRPFKQTGSWITCNIATPVSYNLKDSRQLRLRYATAKSEPRAIMLNVTLKKLYLALFQKSSFIYRGYFAINSVNRQIEIYFADNWRKK